MQPLPHKYSVSAAGTVQGDVSMTAVTRATLTVPADSSTLRCARALTKAEEGCLIGNSLRCERELQIEIVRTSVSEPERQTG